ncbi:hypothetical protein CDLVIII_1364 [Clostridium sp. DL-VIII]|uniref:hypothetical protein n=1 Tax=Clostridium sp. DL-VIII TaxID=641107 RepID=UPI00023AF853|nr:hypothetical protein [Clostridium sp. DL-VIII]EHI98063.1 hypothetical protein CDLVIII_1364 [Clostridium sp. DL-VIII]
MGITRGLIKPLSGFFILAMCIAYNQQIGLVVAKAVFKFGEIFSSVISPIFLRILGI